MTTLALAILTVGMTAIVTWEHETNPRDLGFIEYAPAIAFISTIISAFV